MCPASLVTWYNYSYKNNRSSINKKTYNIWGHHKNPENPVQRHTQPQLEKHTHSTLTDTLESKTHPITNLNALLQKHIITLQLCFFTERWHVVIQAAGWASNHWHWARCLMPSVCSRDVELPFLQEVTTPQRSAEEFLELWHHLYFPFESRFTCALFFIIVQSGFWVACWCVVTRVFSMVARWLLTGVSRMSPPSSDFLVL